MSEDELSQVRIPLWQPIFTLLFLTAFPLIILWLAGDWKWVEGRIFIVVFWIFSLVTSVRMYVKDPGLFRERFSAPVQQNQRPWDKIVIFLVITSYLLWMVIIPLDARRFGWSPPFPIWLKAIGLVLTIVGFWLFYETFKENTFAAPVVKIQKERKQKVISTGVYGFVRHPLYLAACTYIFGGALLMGSIFGLLAGLIFAVVVATRSIGEEQMLLSELEGYSEYARRVKWRLFPYIF
jgi:protein-S-isoprenylcysteine O-methyltransferase Ste14